MHTFWGAGAQALEPPEKDLGGAAGHYGFHDATGFGEKPDDDYLAPFGCHDWDYELKDIRIIINK